MPTTVNRSTLLGYFEARKKPTEAQYADLVNTSVLFEAEASSSQNTILMDFINEKSTGVGVTIESVTINDGAAVAPNGFVGTLTGSVVGNVIGDITGDVTGAFGSFNGSVTVAIGSTSSVLGTQSYTSSLISGDTASGVFDYSGAVMNLTNQSGFFESKFGSTEAFIRGNNKDLSMAAGEVMAKTIPGGTGAFMASLLNGDGLSFETQNGLTTGLRFSVLEFTGADFVNAGGGIYAASANIDTASSIAFMTPSVWHPSEVAWVNPDGAINGVNWVFKQNSGLVTVKIDTQAIPGNPAFDSKVLIWHEAAIY